MSEHVVTASSSEVIAALRLGMEASSDDETLRVLVAELLTKAPPTDPRAIRPVQVLIEAIRAVKGELVVKRRHDG